MTLNWFIVDPTKPEGFKVEKPWSIGGVEDLVSPIVIGADHKCHPPAISTVFSSHIIL